jgi:D-aspartate ligase
MVSKPRRGFSMNTSHVGPVEPRPEIQPVILGGDIGVYALARAFHEQYGVTSIVISGEIPGPIAHSKIIENVKVNDSHNENQLLQAALTVAKRADRSKKLILLANSDWLVRTIVRARKYLEDAGYVVPFLSEELLDDVSDKATFAELAVKTGIAVPETVVVDFSEAQSPDWRPPAVDLGYPLIAKAASSADYQEVEFPEKVKVFEIDTPADLAGLWKALQKAGYKGRFVAQEMIPGDDSFMRSITAYVDAAGEVTLLAGAQVLVEEHTPNGLGNPAAMVTGDLGEMFEQAVGFLKATGYRGFANFDVKVDPRDGVGKFFEVNPRIGRNNYYVTAAGANVAQFVVGDAMDGVAVAPQRVSNEILYSVLPNSLLLKYVADAQLKAKVKALMKDPGEVHPLAYWAGDGGPRRRLYVAEAKLNQKRKFDKWYPEVTGTGLSGTKVSE